MVYGQSNLRLFKMAGSWLRWAAVFAILQAFLLLIGALYSTAGAAPPAANKSANQSASQNANQSAPAAPAAGGEKRLALVIGNARYPQIPLNNPENDARVVAATLRRLGFDVSEHVNLKVKDFRRVLREFARRVQSEDGASVFYFAGHGVQIDGRNYLLPVDVNLRDEEEVKDEAVDIDELYVSRLERARTQVRIVILDACRDNPFAGRTRSFKLVGGLAERGARGALIAYSSAPGATAEDGPPGTNSVYTRHLVKEILAEGVDVEQMFKAVRIKVLRDTNERQVPWVNTSLTANFTFNPRRGPSAEESAKQEAISVLQAKLDRREQEQKRLEEELRQIEKRLEAVQRADKGSSPVAAPAAVIPANGGSTAATGAAAAGAPATAAAAAPAGAATTSASTIGAPAMGAPATATGAASTGAAATAGAPAAVAPAAALAPSTLSQPPAVRMSPAKIEAMTVGLDPAPPASARTEPTASQPTPKEGAKETAKEATKDAAPKESTPKEPSQLAVARPQRTTEPPAATGTTAPAASAPPLDRPAQASSKEGVTTASIGRPPAEQLTTSSGKPPAQPKTPSSGQSATPGTANGAANVASSNAASANSASASTPSKKRPAAGEREPPARGSGSERCVALLIRAQLGEPVSPDDMSYLQKECR